MTGAVTEELLRRLYQAYATMDVEAIDAVSSQEPVLHVPGEHPLSGEHRGRSAMWAYLGKVAEVAGGQGGYELHGVTTDPLGHGVALLTGRIRDFIRPLVHVWRVENDLLAEYWEVSLDQKEEDRFWSGALAADQPSGGTGTGSSSASSRTGSTGCAGLTPAALTANRPAADSHPSTTAAPHDQRAEQPGSSMFGPGTKQGR